MSIYYLFLPPLFGQQTYAALRYPLYKYIWWIVLFTVKYKATPSIIFWIKSYISPLFTRLINYMGLGVKDYCITKYFGRLHSQAEVKLDSIISIRHASPYTRAYHCASCVLTAWRIPRGRWDFCALVFCWLQIRACASTSLAIVRGVPSSPLLDGNILFLLFFL